MNSGVGSPRPVTRGESPPDKFPALVDWLSFTVPVDAASVDLVVAFLRDLFPALGAFHPRNRGLHGYRDSWRSDHGEARVAAGGNAHTVFVDLPAQACAACLSWVEVREFLTHHNGRITRCDLAVDCLAGEYTVDQAVELYRSGVFNAGGRSPSLNQAGNWIDPDGRGRTLYVGRGKNGKMLRVYEKGKQLGDVSSLWVRWEVQLRAVDRGIPHAALTEPATFIGGAYPALAWVCEGDRIATLRAVDGIVLDALVKCARTQYGRLVDVLLARDCSPEDVVARLRRPGQPKRLGVPDKLFQGIGVEHE